MASLAKYCVKLKYFASKYVTVINDSSFKQLAQNCSNLVHVSLQNCHVSLFKANTWDLVWTRSHISLTLKTNFLFNYFLSLSLFKLKFWTQKNLTDDSLITLANNCHNLQFLCISNCKHLTDSTLQALGKNCLKLKILEASGCTLLSDVGFVALSKVKEENVI